MNNVVLFAAVTVVVAGAASQLAGKLDHAPPAAKPPAALVRAPAPADRPDAVVTGPHKVSIPRDRRGHYAVEAAINGRRMDVMVDTGASVVALTRREAGRLGLNPAPSDYTVEVRTANGTVRAARVVFDAVEIGGIRVRDVAGLVVPDDALGENLLGLSFLSRLRRYEFADGRLVMEQ